MTVSGRVSKRALVSKRTLWRIVVLGALLLIGGGASAWFAWADARTDDEILRLLPDDVLKRPDLVAHAVREAKPVYAANCAACHGSDFKGNTQLGAPDLADKVWLYGAGNVSDIEHTILYGIRAHNGQTHNVTEMPAYGLRGYLTANEIGDVVQYLLALNHRPNLAESALAGRDLYLGKGECGDCHGAQGSGDPFYGSTNLTVDVWNNGGDEASLYRSIYDGVAHEMPAWYGVLPLEKIRALAIYLHTLSHPDNAPYTAQPSQGNS